ncbi:MAG: ArsR/SmtB family transcription factor [Hominilimicola sp.]
MNECSMQRKFISDEFQKCLALFSALGDEIRQQIFITILEHDPIGIRVPEITEKSNLSRPAVSHHLKILKDAKIISMRRVGTKNYYYANADTGNWTALKNLSDHICSLIPRAVKSGYPNIDEENFERND